MNISLGSPTDGKRTRTAVVAQKKPGDYKIIRSVTVIAVGAFAAIASTVAFPQYDSLSQTHTIMHGLMALYLIGAFIAFAQLRVEIGKVFRNKKQAGTIQNELSTRRCILSGTAVLILHSLLCVGLTTTFPSSIPLVTSCIIVCLFTFPNPIIAWVVVRRITKWRSEVFDAHASMAWEMTRAGLSTPAKT